MKRAGIVAAAVGLAWLALLVWRRGAPVAVPVGSVAAPAPPAVASALPAGKTATKSAASEGAPAATGADERSHLADELNAVNGTVARDLAILATVLDAWQTNFPRTGNPVGENAEITAALAGANPLRLALIPPGHPALNSRGELCDRWGTPFFFHQIGARQMEIRSAGPDRRLYTDDDVVLTPPQ